MLKLTEKYVLLFVVFIVLKMIISAPRYCELMLTYLYPVPTFDLVISVEVDYKNRNTHVSLRRTVMNDVDWISK